MSIRLEVMTPVVDASPGAEALGRVIVRNDAPDDIVATIEVVGLGGPAGDRRITEPGSTRAVTVEVPGASSAEATVPIHVPLDLSAGQHAAAFQAMSGRPGDRPVLSPFTVSLESIENVGLVVDPVPIRGRRRAKFVLAVSNDEPTPVSFTVDGEATDLSVKFATPSFKLLPGQRAVTRAKVRGPRLIVGEPVQHNLVIAARGRAAATTVTAPFVQRPLFAHRAKALVAALAVIALWLAAIGGAALWISNRAADDEAEAEVAAANAALVQLVDANGDPLDSGPYSVLADGTIVDADGKPVDGFTVDASGNVIDDKGNPINGVAVDPDTGVLVDDNGTPIGLPPVDADGNPIGDVDGDGSGGGDGNGTTADGGSGGATTNGEGGAGSTADGGGEGSDGGGSAGEADDDPVTGIVAPTSTLLRGTVSVDGSDDLSDVSITLAPLDLGTAPTPDSTVIAPPGSSSSPTPDQTSATKLWSARFAPIALGMERVRQTEPVLPVTASAGDDGIWLIPDVQLRRTYELAFTKPGFDTRSFVISPPDDGSPVELDVQLEPSRGVISGRVVDGGTPLGGVEVALSDGTLTFTTTSDTDGDVGAFAFEAVSTPNTYTLIASRDGYGTEVLQLPMEAGEQRTDVTISMSSGVATVSGSVVDENGQPLGGVTVTASNGETTQSTTSLTEGRVGFFSIPRLEVGVTYTVTAQFDGFVTQTRRVPLNGSTGGVNFALNATTAQLSGVISSEGGGGIVGASVSLANADLEFDVATAASPQAGAFSVADLPPGNYTVTVEHFEHDTITELIEIVAGTDPAPLALTMPVRTRGIDAGTGSLVVEVIDPAAEDADEREVRGATVRLVVTRTGVEFVSRTDDDSFTFEFDDIPVGTYTILVSAPLYNDAAPRTVSIGRSQERRTINMAAFGAASGSMVDSITGEVITGYTVKFFEQDPGGGAEREITPAEVNVAASSDGVWATAPRVLPTGRYRLEVTGASGYQEPTLQQLDPALPPMQFLVELNSGQATEIPVLVANRYPDIFGRVYRPRLIGGPAAPATGTQFDAIDEPSLTAGMRCGGELVTMEMRNEFGTTAGDALDAFFLSRQAVDANDLLGECEIEISADGYVTSIISLPNVSPTEGVTLTDRVVTAALHRPADTLGGRVFWVDPRFEPAELPLVGVEIFADAITSFTPTDDSPIPTGAQPTASTTRIETESTDGGLWTLDGQVFGGARYTFREFGFQDGLVDVVIDENRTRTITDVSGVDITITGDVIAVELEPPNDGVISGQVGILTVDQPADFDDVGIVATNPFSNTTSDDPTSTQCTSTGTGLCLTRNAGDFQVAEAAAGTWTVDFTLPDNHAFFGGAPTRVEQLVGPQESKPGFDTTLVELGQVDVELIDQNTKNPIDAEVTFDFAGGGSLDTTFTGGSGTDSNVYTVDDIPVHPTDPLNQRTNYTVDVRVRAFDQATSRVFLDNVLQTGVRSDAIPLSFLAGEKPQIRIELESFGKVTTEAFGITPDVPSDQREQLTPDAGFEVTFRKVFADGTPDTSGANDLAGVITNPDGTFSISGPEGWYEITVTDEHFDDFSPPRQPTGGTCTDIVSGTAVTCDAPLSFTTTGTTVAYRVENGTDHRLGDEFELDVRRSQITINVFEMLNPDGPVVTDARFQLFNDATDLETDGTNPDPTDGNRSVVGVDGTVTFSTVPRALYELRLTGVNNDRFPVIVRFTLPPSTDTVTGSLTVRAPLPSAQASISGAILAQNSRDEPVPLPQFDVTNVYAAPQIEVGTDEVDNRASAETTLPNTPDPADGSRATYLIPALPAGEHQLTFPDLTGSGYIATFADDDAAVVGIQRNLDPTLGAAEARVETDLVYDVLDYTTVTATLDVQADVFPNLVAKLVRPGGDPTVADEFILGTFTPPDGTSPVSIQFADVAPHIDDYRLLVTDDLHVGLDQPVPIPVDVGGVGTLPLGTFSPNPNAGRVTGTLFQDDGAGNTNPVSNTATLSLISNGAIVSTLTNFSGAPTTYEFDVPLTANANYILRLDDDGFLRTEEIVTIPAGGIVEQDLTIVSVATLQITVAPFAPNDISVGFQQVSGTTNIGNPITPMRNGAVFTADVPAGQYRIIVSGGGLANPLSLPTTPITAPAGQLTPQTITVPRTLTVQFTGDNRNIERTVEILNGSGTSVASLTQTGNGGDRTFQFGDATSFPAGARIPSTGDLTVITRAEGQRTQSQSVVEAFDDAVSVDLLDAVAVSGRLLNASDQGVAGTITMSRSDTTDTVQFSSNASGNISYPDLGNADDGSPVTYTFTATVDGAGEIVANNTITVGATSPTGAQTLDLDLVPRSGPVTITIESGGTGIAGATVALENYGSGITADGTGGTVLGEVTFSMVEEDDDDLDITITSTLYEPSGTPAPLTNAEILAGVATRMVDLKTADVTFNVTGLSTPAPNLEGVEVVVTASDLISTVSGTTGATGAVTLTLPATFGLSTWVADFPVTATNPAADDYESVASTSPLDVVARANATTPPPPVPVPVQMPFIPIPIDVGGTLPADWDVVVCAVVPIDPAPANGDPNHACDTVAGTASLTLTATADGFELTTLPPDDAYRLEKIVSSVNTDVIPFTVTNRQLVESRPITVTF